MALSKVFVVNEPYRRDNRTGDMIPMHDLSPASEFGEMIFILPQGNRPPLNPETSLLRIRPVMRHYTAEDYILEVGDFTLFACTVALAAKRTGGIVRILRWDSRPEARRYFSVPVELWREKETVDG